MFAQDRHNFVITTCDAVAHLAVHCLGGVAGVRDIVGVGQHGGLRTVAVRRTKRATAESAPLPVSAAQLGAAGWLTVTGSVCAALTNSAMEKVRWAVRGTFWPVRHVASGHGQD